MYADASDLACGAVLKQEGNQGTLQPVAFFSRKWNSAELNYTVHDKELLAIISALKEWRHLLLEARFPVVIKTDHRNLESFMKTKI